MTAPASDAVHALHPPQVRRFIRLYGPPAILEAVQFNGGNFEIIRDWMQAHGGNNADHIGYQVGRLTLGLDGRPVEELSPGAWIVRDETGRCAAWYGSSFAKSFVPMPDGD